MSLVTEVAPPLHAAASALIIEGKGSITRTEPETAPA